MFTSPAGLDSFGSHFLDDYETEVDEYGVPFDSVAQDNLDEMLPELPHSSSSHRERNKDGNIPRNGRVMFDEFNMEEPLKEPKFELPEQPDGNSDDLNNDEELEYSASYDHVGPNNIPIDFPEGLD